MQALVYPSTLAEGGSGKTLRHVTPVWVSERERPIRLVRAEGQSLGNRISPVPPVGPYFPSRLEYRLSPSFVKPNEAQHTRSLPGPRGLPLAQGGDSQRSTNPECGRYAGVRPSCAPPLPCPRSKQLTTDTTLRRVVSVMAIVTPMGSAHAGHAARGHPDAAPRVASHRSPSRSTARRQSCSLTVKGPQRLQAHIRLTATERN